MTTNPLSHEQIAGDTRRAETARLLRAAAGETGEARDDLIDQVVVINTGVARSIARGYAGRGVPLEDLEQVACLALVRAAQRFDAAKADDFLSYAVPTIRGEIKRWFRDNGWGVRPPRRLQELQAAANRVRNESAARGAVASTASIAKALGVDEREVGEALSLHGCFAPASLDAPVQADHDLSVGDLLPAYDDELAAIEVRLMLEQALATLTKRERLIVRLRFNEELTQKEIAELIGVTQMQVSRILARVMVRLRELLSDDPMARGESWSL